MLKTTKQTKGFTIIEVMIVLAIAGLILLIVFLAVPALQRNSRNASRRSDVSHIAGLMNEYASNNQGVFPSSIGTAAAAGRLVLGSEKFSIMTFSADPYTVTPCTAASCTPAATIDQFVVRTNATCNAATMIYDASTRQAAVSFLVEGSGGNVVQCTPV